MKRFAKLPIWYSVVSVTISLFVIVLMLILPTTSGSVGPFKDLLFFLLVASYLNCLPLALVSILLLFRKGMRKYGLINFVSIVVVLYFAVKVFGTAI